VLYFSIYFLKLCSLVYCLKSYYSILHSYILSSYIIYSCKLYSYILSSYIIYSCKLYSYMLYSYNLFILARSLALDAYTFSLVLYALNLSLKSQAYKLPQLVSSLNSLLALYSVVICALVSNYSYL